MRIRMVALIASMSAIFGSLMGAGAIAMWGGGTDGAAPASSPPAVGESSNADSKQDSSFSDDCLSAADVYEQVRPSVVEITSTLGAGEPFGQQAQGTGTGIVIDADGAILTNNHVINGASSVEVRFADGSAAEATVLGNDPANDLAVIKVNPSGQDLVAADLGDSDSLRVGDPVLALGNPFNLEATLTQGIVSAIDRTYATGANTRPIREMIQTDAAVNPGNSGGPLLNCRGEVIGINTLLENPTGENVNVGVAFAVAVNTAKRSLPQMTAGESVSHAWLGIAGVDVTPALAEELGLDTERGVYVTLVSANSPADDAGLHAAFQSENAASNSNAVRTGGDVILSLDGEAVAGIDELASYLDANGQPGGSVVLTVLRSGEKLTIIAQLAEWPA